MPEKLAELPGLLRYIALLAQDDSVFENDQIWISFSTWYENSQYKPLRRVPLPDKKKTSSDKEEFNRLVKTDCRRLFMNLRGRSAKSGTSMSTVNFANINAIYAFLATTQNALPSISLF
jgi:hypothetical protein